MQFYILSCVSSMSLGLACYSKSRSFHALAVSTEALHVILDLVAP